MKISSALRFCFLVLFPAVLAFSNANAQSTDSWPNKQIRIVVPYVAGAMGDVVARRLTEGLRNELGQAVLVENRPGAATVICTALVAQRQRGQRRREGETWTWVGSPAKAWSRRAWGVCWHGGVSPRPRLACRTGAVGSRLLRAM